MSGNLQSGGAARSDFWELDGHRAILHTGRLVGMIDLAQPSHGLTAIRVDGAAIVGSLMGVDVSATETRGTSADEPWTIADAYIRGRDLVASYREPRELPFNLQLYWRAIDAADGTPTVDLICSVQTPLWEAHPQVTVSSSAFARAAAVLGEGISCISDSGAVYCEATRLGDFTATAAETDRRFSGAFWNFGPQFMEKGVIRRLQVRGAFGGDDARSELAKLHAELAGEEPALTA
ncbi:hypothetical protein [Lacipirellula parvula]|uniref:Uncharacterized protein n=1 Tax=Lacipirellula parvula TaxID=2650471 RepID=A0A5K7X648_9BACT|nr:hypothetical protein [Lacipirellula parvula]BBO31282.1 hypothetical protein PLANPX_0894 [Lacipirellula parvula]